MREVSCDKCTTKNCFIQTCKDEKLLSFISGVKRTSFYKKKQHVVFEGNQVMGLYFILSGKIKVVSSGLYGKTQVVRLTQNGDVIGHRGYGGETYPISAITIDDSEICFVDNDSIYKAFMDNPKLTFELMMYYSKELRASEAKIKNLAQMSVREKVVDSLLYAEKLYNEEHSSSIQIDRQDLADLAGINTEQLSRVLSELKKEKILTLPKNEIIINDRNQLVEIVEPFNITY
jgi:CRP-like cAMP-binding protein